VEPKKRFALAAFCVASLALPAFAADPLPSWNDTAPKKAIVTFVERVTKEGSPDFVPPAERIATFDQDGTLWAEQPMYFQLEEGRQQRPRQEKPHPVDDRPDHES